LYDQATESIEDFESVSSEDTGIDTRQGAKGRWQHKQSQASSRIYSGLRTPSVSPASMTREQEIQNDDDGREVEAYFDNLRWLRDRRIAAVGTMPPHIRFISAPYPMAIMPLASFPMSPSASSTDMSDEVGSVESCEGMTIPCSQDMFPGGVASA
jgi:hypothetical protein